MQLHIPYGDTKEAIATLDDAVKSAKIFSFELRFYDHDKSPEENQNINYVVITIKQRDGVDFDLTENGLKQFEVTNA